MGWWRRMRNKFKTRKTTARPTRYTGHVDHDPTSARAQPLPSPPRTPPEKALLESEERYSMSGFDQRPSMMSDRTSDLGPFADRAADRGAFEQMSFELPRR